MLEFLTGCGIWVVGVSFLIDDLGIPFPSGTLLFSTSIWAHTHPGFFLPLFVAEAIFLSMLGNTVLYYWGRRGAREWLRLHGHRIFLPRKRLQKIETFFGQKHGPRTIFLMSLVNNARPICAILAGASKMAPKKFFPMSFLGIILWATGVSSTGYLLGTHANTLWQNDGKLLVAAGVAYGTGYIFWILIRKIFHLHNRCPKKSS